MDALYPPPLYGSPGGAGACTPPYPGVHPVRPPTTAELLRAAHSAGGGLALSPSPGSGLPHALGGEAARQALGHSPQGAPMQASGVAAPPGAAASPMLTTTPETAKLPVYTAHCMSMQDARFWQTQASVLPWYQRARAWRDSCLRIMRPWTRGTREAHHMPRVKGPFIDRESCGGSPHGCVGLHVRTYGCGCAPQARTRGTRPSSCPAAPAPLRRHPAFHSSPPAAAGLPSPGAPRRRRCAASTPSRRRDRRRRRRTPASRPGRRCRPLASPCPAAPLQLRRPAPRRWP